MTGRIVRKGIAIFVLAVVFAAAPLSGAGAEPADVGQLTPQQAADRLHEQGLMEGTGKGYELEREMTRAEAVTMLVKLLGKNEEAQKGTWTLPFTDVEEWAKPYVGYAYANGLTAGITAARFGSQEAVSYTQYLTFMLKALGYEEGKDFQWDKAYLLANEIGLAEGVDEGSPFLRADAAVVSLRGLALMEQNGRTNGGDSTDKGQTEGESPTPSAISIKSYDDFSALWKKNFFNIENGVEGYVYETKKQYQPQDLIEALKKVPADLTEYYAKEFLNSVSKAKNSGIYFVHINEDGTSREVIYTVRKLEDDWTFTSYIDDISFE